MKIQPIYVSFKQANLLKEKGWDIECEKYYHYSLLLTSKESGLKDCYRVYAPEQWRVVEWLRVNHGIFIEICYWKSDKQFQWKIDNEFGKQFDTPQEAYSAAFDYVLNNLIWKYNQE